MPTDVICVLCGSNDSVTDKRFTAFLQLSKPLEIQKCSNCGMIFMNPQPTGQQHLGFHEMVDFYSPTYQLEHQESLFPCYNALLDSIEGFGAQGRDLLDVGCGIGGFLKCASLRGWSVSGTEGSRRLADFAQEYASTRVLNLDSLAEAPFEESTFDVITFLHVLEHLPTPLDAIIEAKKFLKPGGVLVAHVPNQYLDILSNIPVYRRRLSNRMSNNGTNLHHLCFFTPETFSRLFEKGGYDIIFESTFAASNRRTMADAAIPAVGALKKMLYSLGAIAGRGPVIEIYARLK